MAKKVTRKQLLKEPDEFITTTGKIIRWSTERRKEISVTVTVILAAAIIMGLVSFFRNRAENQAFALLQQANEKYRTVLEETNEPAKALGEAHSNFETIVDEYSGYNGGKIARVEFANYCYDGGEYAKAAELFQKALDDLGADPAYRNFILSGLAYARDALEDYKSAARYFEMIASSDSQLLKDEALFNLGRVHAALGNAEKSTESYQKLVSEYPDSIYVEMAKERIRG